MATALAATVQPQYGRVQLQLTFTTVTSATVSRVHADGTVWPVRGGDPAQVLSTTGVGWVGYDHEAPLDQAVTYRATSGVTTFSSSSVTVPSSTADLGSRAWLTHPLKPALSQSVLVTFVGPRTRKARRSVLPIVASADPVALTDTRLSPEGEIGLFTATLAEELALDALLDDGAVLCVRAPAFWGSMWFYASIGDVPDEPSAGHGRDPSRDWRLPYTVVAPPAGAGTGAVTATWADVIATYATWNAVIAGEPTWNDLMLKPGP